MDYRYCLKTLKFIDYYRLGFFETIDYRYRFTTERFIVPITDSGYGSAICMLQWLNILLRLPFSIPSFHPLLTSKYVLRRNKQEQKYCWSAVNYILLWITNQSMYNDHLLKPKRFLILESSHLPAATLNFSKRYTSFVKVQYARGRQPFECSVPFFDSVKIKTSSRAKRFCFLTWCRFCRFVLFSSENISEEQKKRSTPL